MTRPTRPTLVASVLVALLALTGCASTVPGTATADPAPPPIDGPGSDPVAWVDRVCGGVLTFAVPATAPPDFTTSADLTAVQRTFSDYLAAVVTGAEEGNIQLAAVGRSPVAGGDEAVGRTGTALQAVAADVTAAKAAVDAADPTDDTAFVAALDRAETTLAAVESPDLLTELNEIPRLGPATTRAQQCHQLAALADTPPR
jgi:hypothetical protein